MPSGGTRRSKGRRAHPNGHASGSYSRLSLVVYGKRLPGWKIRRGPRPASLRGVGSIENPIDRHSGQSGCPGNAGDRFPLQVPRGRRWPRQRGSTGFLPAQAGRFVWRPGPRNGVGGLADHGGRAPGRGGRPTPARGPVAPLEGEATPARSARNLTAVGKSHLLT